ncbi:uncharacterized protein LOC113229117 isoform X2 [Hyposmocoma kahamanoa]|uniref:uncharacterized protein LOC113229117 isoform X2 n=1 Tax=Hyposmocoma kahamanoa TaxID=1477025 RepID=UPI000E6D5B58|nr:uncharacterized protein LOC113229117 isoform X2 [Hyposmocoma kahamanoa]
MFTISCYDLHPLAAKYRKIWQIAQHASDCMMVLMAVSCCKCWSLNIGDSDSSDDDDSINSYKITAKTKSNILKSGVNLSKTQEDPKEHQVEVEIHHHDGAGDVGGSKHIVEMLLDSDSEVKSDVNASDQKLVFESSVSSIESKIGGVKNDCYQDSDSEDIEIIEMSSSFEITNECYTEDTVSTCLNSSVMRSSLVEIKQTAHVEARSSLQSASRFPSVHSTRKTDKNINRLNGDDLPV